jgi:FkbM family methyltransferase
VNSGTIAIVRRASRRMLCHLRRLIHILGMQLIDRRRFRVVSRSRFAETLDKALCQPGFFFIQVGAHDGVRFDDLYGKVTAVNARGIVIEPLPRYFARLRMNYEDYPGVIPLNVALHPTAQLLTLHHVLPEAVTSGRLPSWAGGTGSANPTHHLPLGIPVDAMTTTTVPAASLRQIIEQHAVSRIDLLQIDTEGFDLDVLEMIPFDHVRPRLIKFEHVSLTPEARGRARQLLETEGYAVWSEGEDTIAGEHEPWPSHR